ncbi:MAG: ABC transporter permease [Terriglobales bacterium]
MLSDLRYAVRMLANAPGFTAVALITLALGIGANTAIFTLINAALLRALPVGHPSQLALLTDPAAGGMGFGTSGGTRRLLAYSEYELLRDHDQAFSGLLAAESSPTRNRVDWSLPGTAAALEPVWTKLVSNNYFKVLEVPAYRGRGFDPAQPARIGAEPFAVLSDGYWRRRFGRDPAAIGRTLRLNGHAFTVIGVAPPGFFGETVGDAPDLFFPLAMTAQVDPGMDRLHDPAGVSRMMWLQAMGRLKPGVSLTQAQAASNVVFLQAVQHQIGAATDAATRRNLLNQKLALTPGGRGASGVRDQFGDALVALFGLVGLVLLLAIVNLASLLLARATARQKEMGVRLALGAGRRRIIRQLLVESVLLSVLGGLLGTALALWGDGVLLRLVSAAGGQVSLDLTPDARVLAFIAAVCLLTGVLFGLAPALRMARLDLNATLQASGRGGSGRSRHVLGRFIRGGLPLGKLLVVGQVTLSIVLLVGAGLFVRSLRKLSQVPLGFQPGHLVLFAMDGGAAGYRGQAAASLFHRLLAQVAAAPGVHSAALDDNGILTGNDCGIPLSVAGYTPPNRHPDFGVRCDAIAGDFFPASGIPILLGRPLNPRDDTGAQNVVINQTFARQVFAHRSPLGQLLHDTYPDDKGAVYTVVGVAGDSKHNRLGETPAPRMYMPFFNGFAGAPDDSGFVLVRSQAAPAAVIPGLRQAIRSVDPNLPLPEFTPMRELIQESLATHELLAKLSSFFGALALLMAAIGLYGVMSYGIARRAPEIGVRMALGASPGSVLGMVLVETAVVVGLGIALGVPASLGGAKLMTSQIHLFGIQFFDPAALATAGAILAVTALLAGFVPAWRASRVDPLAALREE